jgi:hypothetical protein
MVCDVFRMYWKRGISAERQLAMKLDGLQLFSADETLAAAHNYAASYWRQCEAERNLLIAVLKDAILDYKSNLVVGGARFNDAERWIFGEDTDRLFAFETICAMLGLSAQRVRADLADWQRLMEENLEGAQS